MEERYDFLSNDPISIETQTTITPIPISHCFFNNTNAIQTGNSDPISAIFNSAEKALSQSSEKSTTSTTTSTEAPLDTTDCERSDEENRQRDSENENVTSGSRRRNNVTVQRENRPINEFSANDVLLLKAFPCYFMLGTGIYIKARNLRKQ